MEKEKLEELTNEQLNELLADRGLNPVVEGDEDRDVAISILSQLA